MSPSFAFDDSEAVEQRLVPVDWYEVEIESAEPKEASTGKRMLTVMFRIVDGEYEGQTLFNSFMLEGRAGGITKAFLRAVTGDASGGSRSTEELVGCRLRVRVIQKPWKVEDGGDGELQNRIVKYNPTEADAFA